jgi:hypothetical protein
MSIWSAEKYFFEAIISAGATEFMFIECEVTSEWSKVKITYCSCIMFFENACSFSAVSADAFFPGSLQVNLYEIVFVDDR